MRHIPEDYCADTIEHIRNRTTCDWCHHPTVPVMPRIHLCKHCNRIRKELNRLEKRNQKFLEQHGGLTFTMQWELDVQRAMVENANLEGRRYGRFYDEDLTDLKFEHEWRVLSERCVGNDLFYGIVNSLNYSLGLNQRRYVFYLLSLINRGWMRKNRRRLAYGIVTQATLDRPASPRPIVVGHIDSEGNVVRKAFPEAQTAGE